MDGPGEVGAQNCCDAAVFTYVYAVVVLRKGEKKKRRILELVTIQVLVRFPWQLSVSFNVIDVGKLGVLEPWRLEECSRSFLFKRFHVLVILLCMFV